MKLRLLYLGFLSLFYIAGCNNKQVIVPEISPNIEHNIVTSIDQTENLLKIIPVRNDLFLIYRDGKIIKYNTATLAKVAKYQYIFGFGSSINVPNTIAKIAQYQCIFRIEPPIRVFNNIVVFYSSKKNQSFIFDLNKMNVVFSLKDTRVNEIEYLNEKIVIYKSDSKLIFTDYINKTELGSFKIKKRKIFNCFINGAKIIICSEKKIFEFNTLTKKNNTYKLINSADFGFIINKNSIYYCSKDRYLIKYSIKKHKILWTYKLPAFATNRLMLYEGHIVLILKNFNIYFINKNGSLVWWDKLGTTPFLSPILMKENIIIALRPKKTPTIKFFNLKKKKTTIYKVEIPFYKYFMINGSIMTLSEDKDNKKIDINRIENVYRVDVKILPETVLIKDQSVEFKLIPINLIKPTYSIKIQDKNKNNVFELNLKDEHNDSFVWFAQKDGDFELKMEVISENRDKIIIKKNFSILDMKKLQYKFYHKVLTNCIFSK